MPMTSPPSGPVEWVALSFPGPVLGSTVSAPLAELADVAAALAEQAQDGVRS